LPSGAANWRGERRSLLVIHQRFNRLLYFFQRHGVPLHELSGKTLYRSPVVADDLASLALKSLQVVEMAFVSNMVTATTNQLMFY
jgi:hypothetical protein